MPRCFCVWATVDSLGIRFAAGVGLNFFVGDAGLDGTLAGRSVAVLVCFCSVACDGCFFTAAGRTGAGGAFWFDGFGGANFERSLAVLSEEGCLEGAGLVSFLLMSREESWLVREAREDILRVRAHLAREGRGEGSIESKPARGRVLTIGSGACFKKLPACKLPYLIYLTQHDQKDSSLIRFKQSMLRWCANNTLWQPEQALSTTPRRTACATRRHKIARGPPSSPARSARRGDSCPAPPPRPPPACSH